MGKITKQIEYEYHNCPIPGGGYVTGFIYHPLVQGILYARTDIGGTYRYDFENNKWISLIEHVKTDCIDETFPIALALDNNNPEYLYIACGDSHKDYGLLCISRDRGETFTYETIPTGVHGNWSGRGTGFRMVVDPSDGNTLYFASQKGGLLRTRDLGKSWERLPVPEDYGTMVYVSEDGKRIIFGTAGYSTRISDTRRSHSLYISYDGGESFSELVEPNSKNIENAKMNGLVASRYTVAGKYLYVTMNSTGQWNYIVDLGYSVDTGAVKDGHLIRYDLSKDTIDSFEDLTPKELDKIYDRDLNGDSYLRFGMGGISASKTREGMLLLTTASGDCVDDDRVYRSYDYGQTWEKVLVGLEIGEIAFNSVYMRPEYNGKRSLIHWLSDIKINPFNENEAWFNSGTGVFKTENGTANKVKFTDENTGLEETVHLNVYAPFDGEVKLVDIVGDLGGFAFRDLDSQCDNSFADAEGNRYITCINADLSDTDSNLGIVAARGNWRGKTKGGLIVTRDNYKSFDRIPMCYGISEKIDGLMHGIETPNVNPGWVAMSMDGENIVWSIATNITLPSDCVISSQDGGKSFGKVSIFDINGNPVTDGLFKAFSDRINRDYFYGFDEKSGFYISKDGGKSFHEKEAIGNIPEVNFGMIDTINKTEVRAESGKSGVFYMALGKHGLWKMTYDFDTDRFVPERLTDEGEIVYRMGLGIGRENGDYFADKKAIYVCAKIDGVYGFFRSTDEGGTWELLSSDKQHYGEINSIDGDKRVFGRFFIATGSNGVKYGKSV